MDFLLKKYELNEDKCKLKVTECHLQEIAGRCCKDWKWLQPHLQMDKIVVDDISGKAIDERDKRLEFFQKWVEKEGSDATYFRLIHALQKIGNKNDAEFVCTLLINKSNGESIGLDSSSQKPTGVISSGTTSTTTTTTTTNTTATTAPPAIKGD